MTPIFPDISLKLYHLNRFCFFFCHFIDKCIQNAIVYRVLILRFILADIWFKLWISAKIIDLERIVETIWKWQFWIRGTVQNLHVYLHIYINRDFESHLFSNGFDVWTKQRMLFTFKSFFTFHFNVNIWKGILPFWIFQY